MEKQVNIEKYKLTFTKTILLSIAINLIIISSIIILTCFNDLIIQVIGKLFIPKNSFYYNNEQRIKTIGIIVFSIFSLFGFVSCCILLYMMKLTTIEDKDIVWFVVGKTKKEQEYYDLYEGEHKYQKNAKVFNIIKNVLDYYMIIALAILCVISIFTFVAFPAEVNQSSMEETLYEGNRVVVLKSKRLDYGDIVVFKYDSNIQKEDHSLNNDLLIKRVIAKANDKFECINGVVYINDVALEEEYVRELSIDDSSYSLFDIVKNNSNKDELFDLITENGGLVPDGYYICLGDNRRISNDSENFGLIASSQIYGKVIIYKNDSGWHKIK